MSPEYDVEEFKKKFPNLAGEIFEGRTKNIAVRVSTVDPWRGYVPTVIDYIRRCRTVEEAFEVIDYLVKRKELSPEEAEKLVEKLKAGGIEAFGGRKEDNYYYKQAQRYWSTLRSRSRELSSSESEHRDGEE